MPVINRLQQVSLFKEIKDNQDALKKIEDIITVRNISKGHKIIAEGDQGDEMFILNAGKVSIEKKTLQDESYTVVSLSDNMNIFFGEQALMDNDTRSATVVAETDCECYVIKKKDFDKLGDDNPDIGLMITREIAKMLSGRLRKANSDVITLFEALVKQVEES